jgi:hypothetical protein
MKLNGKQIKQIQEALLAPFDADSLRRMGRVELDERLADIVWLAWSGIGGCQRGQLGAPTRPRE